MESAAVLRSFQGAVGTNSHLKSLLQRPGVITINSATFSNLNTLPVCGRKNLSSTKRHGALLVSCVKTSETNVTVKSKGDANGTVLSDSQQNGVLQKKSAGNATFPTGFEALLSEVCNETKIAELKVKFGAFEVHMKRNIDAPTPTVPAPVVSQTTTSPAPTITANESTPPPPPKPSTEKTSPFTNISAERAAKLASLEATGATGYVLVSSSKVGEFRRSRTLKGKKQPPACKEGDVIKEGQVIGFLDVLGSEFPVRADVDGEVLKLIVNDDEAVGYGDPLVAVLPSFHGIK